ncbi:MAG: hypothetical protein ISS70_10220 [Phycisphaerae bacterium]|nr:hypothetical protein [Phycisphaerae bacterium]
MTRELKTLFVVAAVAALVYFMAFAGTSVAEHAEIDVGEQFGGVTISVEACVVRVAIEALEQIGVGSDILSLGSIPAGKVLESVGREDAEVVSSVKLALGNDSLGEITVEENSQEKDKDHADGTGERAERETSVSFQAEASVRTAGKIAVKFSFKQIVSENVSSASGDGEQEEKTVDTFEVSSRLALQAGQPRVAGAQKNEDAATFLILRADI